MTDYQPLRCYEHDSNLKFYDTCIEEPGYNDIGLCDILSIISDILWYQFTPHS